MFLLEKNANYPLLSLNAANTNELTNEEPPGEVQGGGETVREGNQTISKFRKKGLACLSYTKQANSLCAKYE